MRSLLVIIVLVYFVGIGVVLAPTFESHWNSGTPAELRDAVVRRLPFASAWPVTLYHNIVDIPSDSERTSRVEGTPNSEADSK